MALIVPRQQHFAEVVARTPEWLAAIVHVMEANNKMGEICDWICSNLDYLLI